jgi:class 3 adenylate cyclase/tRNA A-37 threonylcarbamoyl transferase component Bud32
VAKLTDPPAAAPAGGWLSSLGGRLFLLCASVVVAAVAVALLVTYISSHAIGRAEVERSLRRSSEVQSMLGVADLEHYRLRALSVSGDPNFVSYIIAAINASDQLSIADELDERQRDLAFSFAVVMDPDGQVAIRTDQPSGERDFSQEPIYQAAASSPDASIDGIWTRDGKLYYAVVVPLTVSGGVLQGYLLLAYAIDDAVASRLYQATSTHVAFLLDQPDGQRLSATSLGEQQATALAAVAAKTPELFTTDATSGGDQPRQVAIEIDGERYLAQAKPLTAIGDQKVGHIVHLGSLDDALAPFVKMQAILAGVGLGAVLLALAVSYRMARRLVQPITGLARAARNAADGDYDQRIDGSKGGAEVDELADTFNILLSELREKRDMQVYLSELSRTLPDQEGVSITPTAAGQRTVTLLAFELRGYSKTLSPVLPARVALEQLAKDLRRLTRSILLHLGTIEAALGHRVVASFEGQKRAEHALSAAADIVTYGRDINVAVVLTTGVVVGGNVTWQSKPVYSLIGEAMELVESLLRVARPGSLLMTKATRDELEDVFRLSGMQAQENKSSVTEQSLYSLPGEMVARIAGPEMGATQELTSDGTTGRTLGTSTMTLSGIGPGSVLADRFEILSQLGAGGMGVVYKARDRKLHEMVALKMLKHDAFHDTQSLERLKDELKLARRIAHPNVLRTYDFGEAEGFPFISMEFVRGVTLKKLLDESGRLPLSAGLHIARQLCRGLQAAHAQAVLHRDIKPENMIIEATGNAKLMDFGIAQPIQRRSAGVNREGSIVGTPYYLAPEQLEGLEPDVRADIYATGVVLFEIFAGELPFTTGGGILQIIHRKLTEEPMLPSTFWPEIPRELERITMRCLERSRDKRYPQVDLLLRDLENMRA